MFKKLPSITPFNSRTTGVALMKSVRESLSKDTEFVKVRETHRLVSELLPYADLGEDAKVYITGGATLYGVHEKGNLDLTLLAENFVPVVEPAAAANSGKEGGAAATAGGAGRQNKTLQQKAVGNVQTAIRIRHPVWRAEEHKRTRLPVLRVLGAPQPFDLTINKNNVVKSSLLLRRYFMQHPDARWIAMGIKRWSLRAGINHDGPHGYLSTNGFNMLIAFWLRARGMVEHIPLDAFTPVADIEQVHAPMPLVDPEDPTVLGDKVKDFLNFYLHEFDLENNVISLARKDVTTKRELGWLNDEEVTIGPMGEVTGGKLAYRLCIEDPFENSQNVGRFVSAFKFEMLKLHLNKALGDGCGFLLLEEEEQKR